MPGAFGRTGRQDTVASRLQFEKEGILFGGRLRGKAALRGSEPPDAAKFHMSR